MQCALPVAMASWISELSLPLAEGPKGWKPYWLHRGGNSTVASLTCHVSVLSPGRTPHELHSHAEEEILLVLGGTPDLVVQTERLTVFNGSAGTVAYYPADTLHTISNNSSTPATYLMLKWSNSSSVETVAHLPVQVQNFLPFFQDASAPGKSLRSHRVFQGPTRWLSRLQCHISSVSPGGGYEAHTDPHDVAIVVLSGMIDTGPATLKACDVAYFCAGEPHGMQNVGADEARYIVFEFERAHEHEPRG